MKKQNKKKVTVVALIVVILIAGVSILAYLKYADNAFPKEVKGQNTTSYYAEDIKFSGKKVSYKEMYGDCLGAYDEEKIKNVFVTSVEELQEYIAQYREVCITEETMDDEIQIDPVEYFDEEFFEKHTLAIEVHDASYDNYDYCLDSVTLKDGIVNININFTEYSEGEKIVPKLEFLFVVLDKDASQVVFNFKTEKVNLEDVNVGIEEKPVVYLYPEEEQQVQVKLGYEENVTCSYPKYENGWNVVVSPDGTLVDQTNGKKLYSLYYESENKLNFQVEADGFVVKGEDSAAFLEEKLEVLGLNYKEAEEFIIYWLPKLEANKYNYIRFATLEEIEENMPLSVSGNPDSVIRVIMEYKGLEQPIKVKEQNLTTPERTGFTVVEWGGMELK